MRILGIEQGTIRDSSGRRLYPPHATLSEELLSARVRCGMLISPGSCARLAKACGVAAVLFHVSRQPQDTSQDGRLLFKIHKAALELLGQKLSMSLGLKVDRGGLPSLRLTDDGCSEYDQCLHGAREHAIVDEI